MGSIKTVITLDEMIDYLNELLHLDPSTIGALVANRVPCNQYLAEHESVQVVSQNRGWHVGLLGILNGMWGTYNGVDGPIAVVFQDGNLVKFVKRQSLK